MLDPSPMQLAVLLSRAKLSPSGPLEHPGCPEAIRTLSGGYPDLIGMDRHTFHPQWNWRLVDPILGAASLCQSPTTMLHFGPWHPNLRQTYDKPMMNPMTEAHIPER